MPIHKRFPVLLMLSLLVLATMGAAAQSYNIVNNELILPSPITFKTGKAVITEESTEALQYIKKYLDEKSYISLLRIECHTDNTGSASSNQSLSEERALAVSRALVSLGADCKRLIAVGFGGTKPIADNATPEGRASNRRVSVFNAALRGRLIGGGPADGGGQTAGNPCD